MKAHHFVRYCTVFMFVVACFVIWMLAAQIGPRTIEAKNHLYDYMSYQETFNDYLRYGPPASYLEWKEMCEAHD